jgi:hypothetical protein
MKNSLSSNLSGIFMRGAFDSIKRGNVIKSLLWMCLVVTLPCFCLACKSQESMRQPLLIAGFVPIGLVVIAYLYFMFKDPDRLHSEEYLSTRKVLEVIETKGDKIDFTKVDLTAIANPYPTPEKIKQIADESADNKHGN